MGPGLIWGLAAACPLLGYVFPPALRLIYIVMMAVALPIGMLISTTLLALLFFLMFTPLAVWFRLRRRDELKRRWDAESASYWSPITDQRTPASYYRQF